MIELDKIYNMDCMVGMQQINDKSIDIVVTSPPYNVGLDYGGYDDNKDYNEYLSFMGGVFLECFRVLKEDGRMCINIGDNKNGQIPTHSDFIQICKGIGFRVISTIIWNKNTISNRTSWGSFMSPSCPSFPCPFEYILMLGKTDKLIHRGVSTIAKENFINWAYGMWTFAPENKGNGHPAPYPVELPVRCIEMLTYKGDVVLDPFMGSGTTAIAAHCTNRHFIGFELNKEYYDKAVERINIKRSQLTLDLFE